MTHPSSSSSRRGVITNKRDDVALDWWRGCCCVVLLLLWGDHTQPVSTHSLLYYIIIAMNINQYLSCRCSPCSHFLLWTAVVVKRSSIDATIASPLNDRDEMGEHPLHISWMCWLITDQPLHNLSMVLIQPIKRSKIVHHMHGRPIAFIALLHFRHTQRRPRSSQSYYSTKRDKMQIMRS